MTITQATPLPKVPGWEDDLPVRCRNLLWREGVTTVGSLLTTTQATMLGWRNCREQDAQFMTAWRDKLQRIMAGVNFTDSKVEVEATPGWAKVKLVECDITVYRHQPTDGRPAYLVVDIDNEADYLALRVYRNDSPVYSENLALAEPGEQPYDPLGEQKHRVYDEN